MSIRTLALMPSWKLRMTASIGAPTRRSTSYSSSRSTESQALVRWVNYSKSAVPSFLATSWSRWTTSSMSSVERRGRKPLCCSGRIPCRSLW